MVSAAYRQLSLKNVIPKVLRVCGNLGFGLFEHFVEHEKLVIANLFQK